MSIKSLLSYRAYPIAFMACIAVFSFGCFKKSGPSNKEFSQIFLDDIWDEEYETEGFEVGKLELQSFETGANEVEVSFSVELVATEDFYGRQDSANDDLFGSDLANRLNRSYQNLQEFEIKLLEASLPMELTTQLRDKFPKGPFNGSSALEQLADKKDSFFVYGEVALKQRGERWKIEALNEIDFDDVPDWAEDARPKSAIRGDWIDVTSKEAKKLLKKYVEDSERTLADLSDELEAAKKKVEELQKQEAAARAEKLKSFIGILKEYSIFDGIVIEQQSLQSRKVRMEVLTIDDSGFAKLEFTDKTVPGTSRSFNAKVEELPDGGDFLLRAVSNEYQRNQGLFFDYRRPIEFLFTVGDDSLAAADNIFDLKLTPVSAEMLIAEAKEQEDFFKKALSSVQPGLVYRGLLRDANGEIIRNLESPVVEVLISFKRVEQEGRMVEAIMALAKNPNIYRPLNGSILNDAFNTGEAPIALRPSGKGTHRNSNNIFSSSSFELTLSPENNGQGFQGSITGAAYNPNISVSMNLSGGGEAVSHSSSSATSAPQAPASHSSSTNSGAIVTTSNNPPVQNTTQSSALTGTPAPASPGLYIREGESWKPLVSTTDFSVKNTNVLGEVTEVLSLFSRKKAAPTSEKLLTVAYPPKRFTQIRANQTLSYVGNGSRPLFHRLDLNTKDNQLEAKLLHDAYRSRQSSGEIYTVSEELKVPLTSTQRGTYQEIQTIVPPKSGWYMFGFDDHERDSNKYLIKID